ncbi:DUF2218 domain-containing protein, partial [Streptomyces sp. NPDC002133]|uniref:DUF2218 domain-containing protein n=1 Tax=Streptomyces sp. NPDC002133 TaxID=3154409 RepID=UPI0033299E90
MLIAEAHVRTDRPSRYLAQLCKRPGQMGEHIRHRSRRHHDGKTPPQIQHVEWSDTHGTIDVGSGRCTLQAGPDSLTLRVEATDQDSLQRIQHLIAGRLQKIGKRDALQVTWQQAEAADHQPDDPATAAPAAEEKTVPRDMRWISRRRLLGAGLGAAAAMGIAACGTGFGSGSGSGSGKDGAGRPGGSGGKGGGNGTSPGPST